MKMKRADCCPFPPLTTEENAWRARHFDMLIAKIGDDAGTIHAAGRLAIEYLQPTYANKWNLGLMEDLRTMPGGVHLDLSDGGNRKEFAARIRQYVIEHDLDGVFLDTPLEIDGATQPYDCVRLFADIQNAMPSKIAMPNFGDYGTWANENNWPTAIKDAWGTLAWLSKHQFVQVAFTTRDPLSFARRTSRARVKLAAGKHLVLGIDDRVLASPDCRFRLDPYMAAALAYSFEHENLMWYYQSDPSPPSGSQAVSYCWNPAIEMFEEGL